MMESWINVTPAEGNGNNTVRITVEPNDSTEERSTSIDVSTSTLNKTVTITQKPNIKMKEILISEQGMSIYTPGKRYEWSKDNKNWCSNTQDILNLIFPSVGITGCVSVQWTDGIKIKSTVEISRGTYASKPTLKLKFADDSEFELLPK